MARGKKVRRDVYQTDMRRFSIYPTYRKPVENKGMKHLKPGDTVRVRISGVDDDGRPTAVYLGYTIIVEGDVEPGSEVRVEIARVEGRTAIARLREE